MKNRFIITLSVLAGAFTLLSLNLVATNSNDSINVSAETEVYTKSGTFGGIEWEYNFKNFTFTISPYSGGSLAKGWMENATSYESTPWGNAGVPEDEIKKIIVNDGVYKIGDYAFEDCGKVSDIWLPDSLTTIGHYGFDSIGEDNEFETIIHGSNVFSVIGTKAFVDSKITGPIIMGEGWERLNANAFTNSHITSIYIAKPNSATFVWEDNAFEDAKYLLDVTICDDLSYVAGGTFNGCTNLKSIEFPNAMNTVYKNAFKNCNAIENVYCRGSFGNIYIYSGNDFLSNRYNYNLREGWVANYIDGIGKTYECKSGTYKSLVPGSVLNGNWWFVRSNLEINHTLEVTEWTTIVLLDNCKLTVRGSIHVQSGKNLYIASESLGTNMGSLDVNSSPTYSNAAIGGAVNEKGASIFICGGNIKAKSGLYGSGIGSGEFGDTNVTIYNGSIDSFAGNAASGIGSGASAKATVTIYGGNVKGECDNYGSGIGSGNGGDATVKIYGGNIEANGGGSAAGIGSGTSGDATVTIYGGSIKANGGSDSAGIGSGSNAKATVNIHGGNIEASRGNEFANNIGAGRNGSAVVNDYRKVPGEGTFMSNGSLTILLGVLLGVFFVTSIVLTYLYLKKRNQDRK